MEPHSLTHSHLFRFKLIIAPDQESILGVPDDVFSQNLTPRFNISLWQPCFQIRFEQIEMLTSDLIIFEFPFQNAVINYIGNTDIE